jgi:hypothetical protein
MEFTDLLYPCAEVSKKLDNWNFLLSCNMKRSVADRRRSPGMSRSMLRSCHYYVHQACTTFSNTSNYHGLRFRTSDLLRIDSEIVDLFYPCTQAIGEQFDNQYSCYSLWPADGRRSQGSWQSTLSCFISDIKHNILQQLAICRWKKISRYVTKQTIFIPFWSHA